MIVMIIRSTWQTSDSDNIQWYFIRYKYYSWLFFILSHGLIGDESLEETPAAFKRPFTKCAKINGLAKCNYHMLLEFKKHPLPLRCSVDTKLIISAEKMHRGIVYMVWQTLTADQVLKFGTYILVQFISINVGDSQSETGKQIGKHTK